MKAIGRISSTAALASLLVVSALPVPIVAAACTGPSVASCRDGHPAPGPIVGAGLPILAIG
jgi:hypothetical protein